MDDEDADFLALIDRKYLKHFPTFYYPPKKNPNPTEFELTDTDKPLPADTIPPKPHNPPQATTLTHTLPQNISQTPLIGENSKKPTNSPATGGFSWASNSIPRPPPPLTSRPAPKVAPKRPVDRGNNLASVLGSLRVTESKGLKLDAASMLLASQGVVPKSLEWLSSQSTSSLQRMSVESCWGVVGAICSKSDTRTTKSGKSYLTWKLTDFDRTVVVSLFGEAYSAHRRLRCPAVVCVASPDVTPSQYSGKGGGGSFLLSINRSDQVHLLGECRDLGTCRGSTKSGGSCGAPVDLRRGTLCAFHASQRRTQFSSRPEFSRPFVGADERVRNVQAISHGTFDPEQVRVGGAKFRAAALMDGVGQRNLQREQGQVFVAGKRATSKKSSLGRPSNSFLSGGGGQNSVFSGGSGWREPAKAVPVVTRMVLGADGTSMQELTRKRSSTVIARGGSSAESVRRKVEELDKTKHALSRGLRAAGESLGASIRSKDSGESYLAVIDERRRRERQLIEKASTSSKKSSKKSTKKPSSILVILDDSKNDPEEEEAADVELDENDEVYIPKPPTLREHHRVGLKRTLDVLSPSSSEHTPEISRAVPTTVENSSKRPRLSTESVDDLPAAFQHASSRAKAALGLREGLGVGTLQLDTASGSAVDASREAAERLRRRGASEAEVRAAAAGAAGRMFRASWAGDSRTAKEQMLLQASSSSKKDPDSATQRRQREATARIAATLKSSGGLHSYRLSKGQQDAQRRQAARSKSSSSSLTATAKQLSRAVDTSIAGTFADPHTEVQRLRAQLAAAEAKLQAIQKPSQPPQKASSSSPPNELSAAIAQESIHATEMRQERALKKLEAMAMREDLTPSTSTEKPIRQATVWICETCRRAGRTHSFHRPPDLCRQENHSITRTTKTFRLFQCTSCDAVVRSDVAGMSVFGRKCRCGERNWKPLDSGPKLSTEDKWQLDQQTLQPTGSKHDQEFLRNFH